MSAVNLVITLAVLAATPVTEARPQQDVQAVGVQPSQVGTGPAVATPSLTQEVQGLMSELWRSGTDGVRNFNNAFRQTASGAIQGVRDTIGAANTFVQNSARAGGELVKGAVGSGLDLSRDAVGATGEFWRGVSGSVNRNVFATADATANFADAYINEVGNLANAASDVARRVLVAGIDNFTNQ